MTPPFFPTPGGNLDAPAEAMGAHLRCSRSTVCHGTQEGILRAQRRRHMHAEAAERNHATIDAPCPLATEVV